MNKLWVICGSACRPIKESRIVDSRLSYMQEISPEMALILTK